MTAPIPPHTLLVFLLQVAVLLLLATCMGRLAMRIGLPAVVGELLTGVLLGPSVLGVTLPAVSGWLLPPDPDQAHLLDAVAQLGILLFVGITGAQLDLKMARRRGATAARVSAAGLVVPLGLGVAAGFMLPAVLRPAGVDPLVFALFIGVCLCVSALPVIARTLTDMNLLHRDIGQLIIVAGTVDDAVGWLLLSIVAAMATVGLHAGGLALSVSLLALFVVCAFVIGRPVLRWAFTRAGDSSTPGLPAAVAVIAILLGAAATHAAGAEPILGAFVVGIVIGSTGSATPAMLAPLRSVVLVVLAPLFLATAGLRVDVKALVDPVVLLAAVALIAVAIIGKFAGAYIGARSSRLSHWEGIALGAGMNARGVVEIVVATTGLRIGVLNAASYSVIVALAIVTSVMAPPILRRSMNRVESTAEEDIRHRLQQEWSPQR